MAQIEIRLPKMGESVTEATITNWLKNIGDHVAMDEPLVEVATDKVDNELPSEGEGTLVQILFEKDQVAQVGDVIAIISTDGSAPVASNEVATPVIAAEAVAAQVQEVIQNTTSVSSNENGKFYSPLVRSIADKEGVSYTELDSIQGSGQGGRVTKADILKFVDDKKAGKVQVAASAPVAAATVSAPAVAAPVASTPKQAEVKAGKPEASGNVEIIEMDRMRKLIAKYMVESKQTSPHVTSYVEADVTNIVKWRDKVKNSFEKREGEKITFTPIFIEAIAKAIKDFPMINISVEGDYIIKKNDINIGMAAALPDGNLIVPVIKNADQLNLVGLTKKVNDLAKRARSSKLTPDEIQGGTYTITNVGSFGNVMGTPIISQPQVAILAVGAIRKLPAVVETPEGDMIAIRHKMFLSHSYDHRVVDGSLGGQFVRRVADYLEQFDVNREI